MVVYYIPFAISTYVPVTAKTIECAAWEKWSISDKAQIRDLTGLLNPGNPSQSGNAKFSDRLVRMFATNDGQTYYVDQTGAVQSGEKTYNIDVTKIADFRKLLDPDEIENLKSGNGCQQA